MVSSSHKKLFAAVARLPPPTTTKKVWGHASQVQDATLEKLTKPPAWQIASRTFGPLLTMISPRGLIAVLALQVPDKL